MAALLNWSRGSSASLFNRIQGKDFSPSPRSRVQDLLHSIKQNLNEVLNSRPGACQSAVELGVIDLNDATAASSDFRKSIEQAIKHCIENYEPRISAVTVQSLINSGDPLLLSFHISARVNFDDMADVVEFNIQLDTNRRYCFNQEA
ncbi:type VI secretion system baseplate subunit TssE [Yersinia aldovae]|uniref:Type VI secretion system lysozyme-like protein n=1 Tax=Yersinia aldovae TaxID=29483 RepID=A0A0T9UT12_YERAL|nr:type VI secretion system baseplate subunit TssE [Yersinia aldovae]CNK27127.1 type VI secretion system lysozyme-like protein [Yersinia aldovae]CNL68524.1 type VI secretion system lysozyme-like protein [Yersinia aldovae]CNL71014.1 type VI secretion system lysozyme-like protein [Yersinia aldovae]